MKKRRKSKPHLGARQAVVQAGAATSARRPLAASSIVARDAVIRFSAAPTAQDIADRPPGTWYASLAAERRLGAAVRAAGTTAALDSEDPVYLGLLLLPVVLLAGVLATGQALRLPSRIALPDTSALTRVAATAPVISARPAELAPIVVLPRLAMPRSAPTSVPQEWSRAVAYAPIPPQPAAELRLPRIRYAAVPPAGVIPSTMPVRTMALATVAPLALRSVPAPVPAPVIAIAPDAASSTGISTGLCRPATQVAARSASATAPQLETASPAQFGLLLAAAAKAQTATFTIYSARYRAIAFPGGDVPDFYGACSDVVIRAYRQLGIDLQQLVADARLGGGDTNIAHRRTESLRALFTREGASLPITDYPEDYQPGDVVTYLRPFSRVSRAHIAIVSDVMGPNRRPLIIHNRGWGTQLEDALFVDRITGHYRFQGVRPRSPSTLVAAARTLQKAAAGPLAARGRTTF